MNSRIRFRASAALATVLFSVGFAVALLARGAGERSAPPTSPEFTAVPESAVPSCASNPGLTSSGTALLLYCKVEPSDYVFRLVGSGAQSLSGPQLCDRLRLPEASLGCAYSERGLIVRLDPAAPTGTYSVVLDLPDGRSFEAPLPHGASNASAQTQPAVAKPSNQSAGGPQPASSTPIPNAVPPQPASPTPIPNAVPPQPAPSCNAAGVCIRASFEAVPTRAGVWHPDDTLAAGPNSLLIVANNTITLRDKAGSVIASASVSAFFAPVRHQNEGVGDPWVTFDALSGRFFYVADGTVGNGHTTNCQPGQCIAHHLLAVSKASNPRTLGTGDWSFYALDRTILRTSEGVIQTANWGDFDSLAIGSESVLIKWPAYRFGAASGSPEQSQGVKVRLIDKAKLIAGQPITDWLDIELRGSQSGQNWASPVEPASGSGVGGPFFLVGFQGCLLTVFAIDEGASPITATTRSVSLRQPCAQTGPAPQPEGGAAIDVVTYGHSLTYRNGSLWYAFASGGGVRFFQVDVGSWPDRVSIVQDGTLTDPGVTYMGPALMADATGNVAIVTARSGLNQYPSLYFAWRLSSDPPNTLRPAELLKAGAATWEAFSSATGARNRFIDFLGAALDPVDGSIWLLGPYVPGPGIRATWIANVGFEEP